MGIQLDAPVKAGGRPKRISGHSEQFTETLKRNEQLVYDALCQSHRPLKAYELLEDLQDHGLRAPMTIYRALEALIAKDCVRKIESLNAFMAVDYGRPTRAHAFLICKECMQAKEVMLDDRQVADLFAPMRVSPSEVRIEAFSNCVEVCQKK